MRGGIVLVTGPTGSGKSTTLAALIDYINTNYHRHIITIEEPIEFVHSNKRSIITQREVPIQTPTFADGLRAALREDADIVLVGEMRDLETISLALTAAETGLLVFGTLHTNNARKTVDRIIDVFPADQQAQVRTMLSSSFRGVVAQLLKAGGPTWPDRGTNDVLHPRRWRHHPGRSHVEALRHHHRRQRLRHAVHGRCHQDPAPPGMIPARGLHEGHRQNSLHQIPAGRSLPSRRRFRREPDDALTTRCFQKRRDQGQIDRTPRNLVAVLQFLPSHSPQRLQGLACKCRQNGSSPEPPQPQRGGIFLTFVQPLARPVPATAQWQARISETSCGFRNRQITASDC